MGVTVRWGRLDSGLEHAASDWAIAAFIVAIFIVFNGYYILFEWMMRGQTPGKRAMQVRVIREDATPISFGDVVIRNLLRNVDFLPGGYLLGGLVSMFHPMHKRLGDLACGTIVVKEQELDYRAHADKKYELNTTHMNEQVANEALTQEERRLINGFLTRRSELLPDARRTLAERLAGPLYEKYGGDYANAEIYLERLYEGRHFGLQPADPGT